MGNVSPSSGKFVHTKPVGTMGFAQVVEELEGGARLTRVAWEDPEVYITMKDDHLMIIDKAKGGRLHPLVLHKEDLFSDDWVTV